MSNKREKLKITLELLRKFFITKTAIKNRIICNIFKTEYEKNALLSYRLGPFENLEKDSYVHSNFKEARYIAKALSESKFNVDVIHYLDNSPVQHGKYDLIMGFGIAFESSFYDNKRKLKRIYYGTGFSPDFVNIQTTKAVHSEFLKEGFWQGQMGRVVKFNWPFQLYYSDLLLILGNSLVASSYYNSGYSKIESINCFFHSNLNLKKDELYDKMGMVDKLHFSWFGSGGIIHKGLLNVIRVLLRVKSEGFNVRLYLCGVPMGDFQYLETVFENLYDVVINCGFISLESKEDIKKLSSVSFNLFPSVSEGGAPAVLNLLAICGIPTVCSQYVGLDQEVIGMQMFDNTEEELYKRVIDAINMDAKIYKKRLSRIYERVQVYSEEAYFNKLRSVIKRVRLDL